MKKLPLFFLVAFLGASAPSGWAAEKPMDQDDYSNSQQDRIATAKAGGYDLASGDDLVAPTKPKKKGFVSRFVGGVKGLKDSVKGKLLTKKETEQIKVCILALALDELAKMAPGEFDKEDLLEKVKEGRAEKKMSPELLVSLKFVEVALAKGDKICKSLRKSAKLTAGCDRWFNSVTCKKPDVAWKAQFLSSAGICRSKVSKCLKQQSEELKPAKSMKNALFALTLLAGKDWEKYSTLTPILAEGNILKIKGDSVEVVKAPKEEKKKLQAISKLLTQLREGVSKRYAHLKDKLSIQGEGKKKSDPLPTQPNIYEDVDVTNPRTDGYEA